MEHGLPAATLLAHVALQSGGVTPSATEAVFIPAQLTCSCPCLQGRWRRRGIQYRAQRVQHAWRIQHEVRHILARLAAPAGREWMQQT